MAKINETNEVKLFNKLIFYGLFICGLPIGARRSIKWAYYTFVMMISCFLILGSIVTLINTPTGLNKLQVTARLSFSIFITSVFLGLRAFQHYISESFSRFARNSPTYIGDEEIQITAKAFINIAKSDLMIFYIVCIIGEVSGILGIIFHCQDIMCYFAYLYSCGSIHRQPMIQFCISEGSWGYFVLNNVMAMNLIISQSLIAQVGQLLLISSTVSIEAKIKRYDDILLASIRRVRAMDKSNKEDYLELKALIKYQQNVMQHIQPLRSNLNRFMAAHVIVFYVMVLCFAIPIGKQKIEPVFLKLPFIVIVSYIVKLHYSICKNCQKINYAEEHFCDILLEFPWYERNIKFQKLYLMYLQLNQKCYPITFLGLCEVNLRFFSANMNRLYSVMNLILLKYKL